MNVLKAFVIPMKGPSLLHYIVSALERCLAAASANDEQLMADDEDHNELDDDDDGGGAEW